MCEIEDIRQAMRDFLNESGLNKVPELNLIRIFDSPMVGIADTSDPLFLKLKDPLVIGAEYLLPSEWLPGAQSVISYFLPFSKDVRTANRSKGWPALEWLYGRYEGEQFNDALKRYLIGLLKESGAEAIAPTIEAGFKVVNRRSNWSERHTAYIAGLGTFGLGRSLITEIGCAGRYGSVITTLKLKPTESRYELFHSYCQECGRCISRCPVGAIKPEGKIIELCAMYSDESIKPKYAPRHGCGKCQTAVPCETRMPFIKRAGMNFEK